MWRQVNLRIGGAAVKPHNQRISQALVQRRLLTGEALATAVPQHQPELRDVPTAPPVVARPLSKRRETVKNAKPFSEFLTDTFNRQHNYLRISVTEKCNLRCLYCMPEEGVDLTPASHLLTTEEIIHLARLFVSQGVTKIRLTGGEPTVRKDIVELVAELGKLRSIGLKELAMTSNGIALTRKLPKLVESGLTGLNLSLDTLDEFKFELMTRRKGLNKVLSTIEQALELNISPLKINCVVMNKLNVDEIPDFVELTRDKPLEVRFIEYMPFSGNKWTEGKMITYENMLSIIRAKYPELYKVKDHTNDTSKTYHIPGHKGKVGFITSMTHNFCGTCNRLRITTDGNIKVCLFGNAEVSLRDMLRKPGGMEKTAEADLLEVIGTAVKGKKARHAGLGELENLPNRPMILIGDPLFGSPRGFTHAGHDRRKQQPSPITMRNIPYVQHARLFHSSALRNRGATDSSSSSPPSLSHVEESGSANMVPVHTKPKSHRIAQAVASVAFSNLDTIRLVRENANKKGDVLAVARIAGIMAGKKTSELIPLCHPVALTKVSVDLAVVDPKKDDRESAKGSVEIRATAECFDRTGVEMEALTAASVAALTIYDMCKAVDKGITIEGTRLVSKKGGRTGDFRDPTSQWNEDGFVG